MPPNPPARFAVSCTGRGEARVLEIAARARTIGLAAVWAATFGRIVERLRADPRGVGDPVQNLRGLRLVVYRAIIDRVEVQYAVHDIEQVVFIKGVWPVLGHPLEDR